MNSVNSLLQDHWNAHKYYLLHLLIFKDYLNIENIEKSVCVNLASDTGYKDKSCSSTDALHHRKYTLKSRVTREQSSMSNIDATTLL